MDSGYYEKARTTCSHTQSFTVHQLSPHHPPTLKTSGKGSRGHGASLSPLCQSLDCTSKISFSEDLTPHARLHILYNLI